MTTTNRKPTSDGVTYQSIPTSNNSNFQDSNEFGVDKLHEAGSPKEIVTKVRDDQPRAFSCEERQPKDDWRPLSIMIALWLGGTGVAVGHHFYYHSLDGSQVLHVDSDWTTNGVRHSQEWKIRFGTAFAFVAKIMLTAAVAFAYKERIWITTKINAITISGLDAMFAAINDVLSFLSLDYIRKVKLGAFIAAIAWLIPLSATITPATLTVVPSTAVSYHMMPVPMINFTNIAPLYSYDNSALGSDMNSADNGVTPYMMRLMSSMASGLNILPMNPVAPNSAYSLVFNGPSLQCNAPTQEVDDMIFDVLNFTWASSGGSYMRTRYDTTLAWLAFPPVSGMLSPGEYGLNVTAMLHDFVLLCVTGPNPVPNPIFSSDTLHSSVQCEGISDQESTSEVIYNHGRIWVWAQNETLDCSLMDTEYQVTFNASADLQTIQFPYSYQLTEKEPYGSYYAITNTLANWLTGAVRGFSSGITTYKTRVSETALFGALHGTTDPTYIEEDASGFSGLAPSVITTEIMSLTRNLSLGDLIEELSRNLTLSLFSADEILMNPSINSNVSVVIAVNIYSYNKMNLLLTYGAAIFLTTICVAIGIYSYMVNDISHDTSFSAILVSTRNKTLDDLIKNHLISRRPVSEAKLKYGRLPNVEGHSFQRAGFGLETEVMAMRNTATRK